MKTADYIAKQAFDSGTAYLAELQHNSSFDQWILRTSPGVMALLPFETIKRAGLRYISDRKDVQDYTFEAFSMLSKHQFIALWNGVITCLHDEPSYKITQPMLLVHGENDQTGDIKKIAPLWAAATPIWRSVRASKRRRP